MRRETTKDDVRDAGNEVIFFIGGALRRSKS